MTIKQLINGLNDIAKNSKYGEDTEVYIENMFEQDGYVIQSSSINGLYYHMGYNEAFITSREV